MANRNAYFRLNIKEDGAYLLLVPSEGEGKPILFNDIDEYLSFKKIDYEKKKIIDALNTLTKPIEIKIASGSFLPENEFVKITVDAEHLKAIGRFYPPSDKGKRLTKEEIIGDLIHAGVKYGVQEKAIESFMQSPQYCRNYILAKATLAVEGTSAEIHYFFNTDLSRKPKTNEDGSVDFHQLDNISHVNKGVLLAELIPAVQGKPGIDVCGTVIRPLKVNTKVLRFGRNIYANEERTKIYSEVDGHVTLVDDQVFVSDTYEVPADVDASTGDIQYEGNVFVKGNVLTGYSIFAKGDIIVNGVVEGATLQADGQIILKRGIQGKNIGTLKAGGNIISKFIESAKISAGGYLSTEAIMHSKVSVKGDIIVGGKKGFITGGEIRSSSLIQAKIAGSTMGTTTILEVGIDPEVLEQLHIIEKEINEMQTEYEKINQQLMVYAKRLKNGEKLSVDKIMLIKSETVQKEELEQKIKENQSKMELLQQDIDENNGGCIKIMGTIYPGCKVTISGVTQFIRKEAQHCRLVKDKVDIRIEAY